MNIQDIKHFFLPSIKLANEIKRQKREEIQMLRNMQKEIKEVLEGFEELERQKHIQEFQSPHK